MVKISIIDKITPKPVAKRMFIVMDDSKFELIPVRGASIISDNFKIISALCPINWSFISNKGVFVNLVYKRNFSGVVLQVYFTDIFIGIKKGLNAP